MMTLPTPSPIALAHSEQMAQTIRQQIVSAGGSISFAEFMQLALYAPGLGYYAAGAHKLGKEGDFVTAPEISPLFAQCIARQCSSILTTIPRGNFLELGAGSGVFARDLLLELENLQTLPEHYFILEVSADLRSRQEILLKTACPHLFNRVRWLEALPTEFTGIIFANEVMDAMPVQLFQVTSNGLKEKSVALEKDEFIWKLTQPSAEMETFFKEMTLPVNYQSEINLIIRPWMTSLAESLKQGVILVFDYGYGRSEYYHPDRTRGTLSCFYRHHRHENPFIYPGLQDITAHVDFTSVVEGGVAAGLHFVGYTNQAAFLLACGLLDIASSAKLDELEQYHQSQAIKTLTLPSEMGELVKVMGFTKNLDISLQGFSLQNRSRDL